MPTPIYPDEMKIEDALQLYFKKYHFADGGYKDKYFKIKIGYLLIPVPNTKSRIAAVKFHDIHHLLTEYTAVWKGEVEIGAWEIASGCGKFLIAWFLNFGSFCVGLILFPKSLYKAFMMGRNIDTNLYYNYDYNQTLLNRTVGDLRKELGIGRIKKNTIIDYTYFILCILLVFTLTSLVVFLFCSFFNQIT